MRVGVVTFPGSLDDRDAQRAVRLAGGEPVALWHGQHDLQGIASLSPIMTEVVSAAKSGMPVLGICNGFQMLAEARLIPGAHTRNAHQQFIRRDQVLRVENASTDWTNGFTEGQEITIPLKNADGRFIADAETIARIEGEGQVAFRYVGVNPNGSMDDIAGVSNARGNVVGLMPHPEHATEPGFGPDMPDAMSSGVDGLTFFTSVIERALSK
jgi:phosphoribosylformylglycinamidine synthase I